MLWPARFGSDAGLAAWRVGSARALSQDWTDQDIARAVEIQRDWDQVPIFRVTDGERLGATLTARGWRDEAPTLMMQAPVEVLTDRPVPRVTSFAIWPPLAIQQELWTQQGIGAARQAVMARAAAPKAALLGRAQDRAAGVGFVSVAYGYAVIHAVEVLPALRRNGVAGWMLREAAFWAREQGAQTMLLGVTAENAGAIALYRDAGFSQIGAYRYFLPQKRSPS